MDGVPFWASSFKQFTVDYCPVATAPAVRMMQSFAMNVLARVSASASLVATLNLTVALW